MARNDIDINPRSFNRGDPPATMQKKGVDNPRLGDGSVEKSGGWAEKREVWGGAALQGYRADRAAFNCIVPRLW